MRLLSFSRSISHEDEAMRTLTLAETKSHFSAVVDQVIAGEEIVITRRGQPVARIIPERARPMRETASIINELRAFLQSQPLQTRPAADIVHEARDGAAAQPSTVPKRLATRLAHSSSVEQKMKYTSATNRKISVG
ncbi:type II toxin-antitoxin system Phd/YefM family antitoxin [Thauera butanivorans]